jgi:hypothetical protein
MIWQRVVYGALCLNNDEQRRKKYRLYKFVLTTGGLAGSLLSTSHLEI